MADTCTYTDRESQTHILHLYRYLFRSEIKTNGRNIDGYYEARTHIEVVHQQQWTQNARETEMCPHHSYSYSNSYILHKSNKIRYVFLPFCHLYFSAFLMCVYVRERARTFTFGNRHREWRQQQKQNWDHFIRSYVYDGHGHITTIHWWSRICGYRNTYFYEYVYKRAPQCHCV